MAAVKTFADITAANTQWHSKLQSEPPAVGGTSSAAALAAPAGAVQLVARAETAPPELDQLPKDALGAGLAKNLATLAAALADPTPRVRLDALDALESSGLDLRP